MYRETLPPRQLGLWLAATSPVVIQLAASQGWRGVAITGAICFLAVWMVWRWGRFGRWVSVGAYILLLIFTGQIIGESSVMWSGNSYPWIPLLILALALWSALKGAKAAAGVGCVLFWVVLAIYPLLYGTALPEVDWSKGLVGNIQPSERLALLLLLPALGKVLLGRKDAPTALLLNVTLGILGAALTLGLGCGSVYELPETIDLLGTVKHYEPLIFSTAMLGWYLLVSYVLTLCGGLGEGRPSVVMGALVIAAWMLCDMHIQYIILFVLSGIFWVAMPIATQFMDTRKKMKKRENTP